MTPAAIEPPPLRREWMRAAVNVLTGIILLFMVRVLWPWTPMAIRTDLDGEVRDRKELQETVNKMAKTLERTAHVVELQATINSSQPGSEEFVEAVRELRRLRQVGVISK